MTAENDYPEGGVFVLGGSGSLGSAICAAFAGHGVDVAFSYNSNLAGAESLRETLAAKGVRVETFQVDASNPAVVTAALDAAAERLGGLHTVIYAGGPGFTPEFFSTITQETWRRWLGADLLGCINLAQAAIPHLRRTAGSFISLSTYQNNAIEPKGSVSSISKAGVDRMVVAIAKEEGRYGVRANSIRAGWFAVEGPLRMLREIPGLEEHKRRSIPVGRLGKPEELGEAAAFRASRRAGFITGVNLTVDGGESL